MILIRRGNQELFPSRARPVDLGDPVSPDFPVAVGSSKTCLPKIIFVFKKVWSCPVAQAAIIVADTFLIRVIGRDRDAFHVRDVFNSLRRLANWNNYCALTPVRTSCQNASTNFRISPETAAIEMNIMIILLNRGPFLSDRSGVDFLLSGRKSIEEDAGPLARGRRPSRRD